ncbi:MAG: 4a-hydroxytetrahydrobiopterin dehydratase [Phycisphaeraceae bacterium]|nr:4a-hydroxytetrahydrobiopterin dehydratase [Phycisphaeraceae bacterium]
MTRLSQEQVDTALDQLAKWTQSGDSIQRTYLLKDFAAAMQFVNAVAQEAERLQHHPDILVRWNKVTLTLSTHDAGGITEKDMDFAGVADKLGASHKSK